MDCPKCNALMEPVSYGGSNTTIDRCTQCHGLWFDLDEAEREYLEGLETALNKLIQFSGFLQ